MENTLDNGDQLIVDKITYRFQDPERFDIIVFPFHYKENTYYIKRIIGLPGRDSPDCGWYDLHKWPGSGGVLWARGHAGPGNRGGTHYSREDEYFVLGDNRNQSSGQP